MKEKDIRPTALFNEYLKIAKEDISIFFSDTTSFVAVVCPACGRDDASPCFEKSGFVYVECRGCHTLYVSPRPSLQSLGAFYRDSRSSRFWAERFYKETEDARREKIFRPRAREVCAKATTYLGRLRDLSFVDVGAGFGTFLQEIKKEKAFGRVAGIEPSTILAEVCRGKGLEIIESPVEKVGPDQSFEMAASFELFEHVYDPMDFLKSVSRILSKGGVFYMTTLSGRGFDIAVLGRHSKSVSPPHHLNFINPTSIRIALDRAGFEVLELDTPGALDVDIVLNSARERSLNVDPFTREILFESEESVRSNFQEFLRQNCLSSHLRVVARKRGTP